MAIAFFYAVGTAVGGITGPLLFGQLIDSGERGQVMLSFLIGAAVMALGGVVELIWGVKAEGQRLEDLALPLSTVDPGERVGRPGADRSMTLACRVFGHRPAFHADGHTMRWCLRPVRAGRGRQGVRHSGRRAALRRRLQPARHRRSGQAGATDRPAAAAVVAPVPAVTLKQPCHFHTESR